VPLGPALRYIIFTTPRSTSIDMKILIAGIMHESNTFAATPADYYAKVDDEATILVQYPKAQGVIQPVIVRRSGERYQLIAGERRWRAAKLAGISTVPAIIREVDGFEQAQMALIENIQREDLNPIDRARSYKTLIEQLGVCRNSRTSPFRTVTPVRRFAAFVFACRSAR
jgi:hypothetical protein